MQTAQEALLDSLRVNLWVGKMSEVADGSCKRWREREASHTVRLCQMRCDTFYNIWVRAQTGEGRGRWPESVHPTKTLKSFTDVWVEALKSAVLNQMPFLFSHRNFRNVIKGIWLWDSFLSKAEQQHLIRLGVTPGLIWGPILAWAGTFGWGLQPCKVVMLDLMGVGVEMKAFG